MLNKVMIIGRLGRDPEVRYTQGGMPVANLNIATDETYVDRDGNRQTRTEWHRVVAFQRLAETCSSYLSKGRLVYVEGSLQTRKWQDQEGKERSTTEIKAQTIKFLERTQDRSEEYGEQDSSGYARKSRRNEPPDDYYGDQPRQQGSQKQPWHGASEDSDDYSARPARGSQRKARAEDAYGDYPGNQGGSPGRQTGNEDQGPAFPSEVSQMDEVPF